MNETPADPIVDLLYEPGAGVEPPTWGDRPLRRPAPARRAVAPPREEFTPELASVLLALAAVAGLAVLFVDTPERRATDLPFVMVFMVIAGICWMMARRRR